MADPFVPRKQPARGSAGGVAEPPLDPLTVGREAARGLNRVTKIAEKEYERQQHEPPPPGPRDEDLADELDALARHLAQLEAGAGEIRMDIYLTHPLPAGFKERMYLDRIEGFRALDDLNDEIARRIQARGRWGPMQLFLHSKVRGTDGRWQFIPGASRTVALDVAKTEGAVSAATAATTAGVTVDPIAAAEKMLEAGKRLMPAQPEKSQAETLGPLITSVAGAFEKLASASSGPSAEIWKTVAPLVPPLLTKLLAPPKDDFLEKLVLMREAGLMRTGGSGSGIQDALAIMRFAFENAPAGAGERTWGDRLFEFLDRHAESGLARGKELIELARQRAAARPAPAVPAAPLLPAGAAPTVPPALAEFQQELLVASSRHDTGFFPTLRERVVTLFPQGGAELIDAVSVDTAADEVGIGRLREAGIQVTPSIHAYLRTFCNWLRYVRRQQQAPPPGAASANGAKPVNARCSSCGTTYQLDDEAQWTADTKRCDNGECHGELVRV